MEIFTPEFRDELFDNLDSIVIELNSNIPFRKTIELYNKIQLAFEKEKEIFDSKKEKNNQLEVCSEVKVMSDYEVAKFMDACMNNPDCGKKEKKKKNKKFKEGDVVYWGNIEGIVEETIQYNSFLTIWVVFKSSGDEIEFTEDGRFSPTLPIVLSHFPYELKMKKIK
jgi:hypothetical protein